MSLAGSYDARCGTYSYKITPKADNCYESTDAYYMTYGVVNNDVDTFCDKVASLGSVDETTVHDENYHANTADSVGFTASWTQQAQVDADKCKTGLKTYVDGCINSIGGDNPMKWFNGESSAPPRIQSHL